jgi:putative hemin transport protein
VSNTHLTPETIRERFSAARTAGKRAKEAAQSIGISEGQAVAAHCGEHAYPPKAVRLQGPWEQLLQSLQACGPLMGLTRNESTVHEKTGVYENISAKGHMGLALGADIDLRLFFDRWHAGFAVTELAANPQNRPLVSLQFFDRYGMAVHKIFPREATDYEALLATVQAYAAPDSEPHTQANSEPSSKANSLPALEFHSPPEKVALRSDTLCAQQELLQAWSAMTDTHEFFGLLKKFDVERQQSFRLAEHRFTYRLAKSAVRELLMEAAFEGTPIMCFVSSPGCIQIHTGPVKRIEPMDIRGTSWLNVIDPSFNLHLREDSIAQVWQVEKPTADGMVTSVEAFDAQGDLMVMFFGARKSGQAEKTAWREIVAKLSRKKAPALTASAQPSADLQAA